MHPHLAGSTGHPSRRRSIRATSVSLAAFATVGSPAAFAHHVADGALPSGPLEGLLSGLAHPVLGFDHLAFLLAAALLVAWSGLSAVRALWLGAGFAVASLAGAWLRAGVLEVPMAEAGVALSLIALAWLLFEHRRSAPPTLAALAIAGGFLHGQAFGESINGATAPTLLAYLAGLVAMQGALLAATHRLGGWLLRETPERIADTRRWVCVACSVVGVAAMAAALHI
jgi:urease accessory protein